MYGCDPDGCSFEKEEFLNTMQHAHHHDQEAGPDADQKEQGWYSKPEMRDELGWS